MIQRTILPLLLPLSVAFLLVSIGLYVCGYSPIAVYTIIIQSSLLSSSGFISVCTKASLMILTGLAVAVPYRCGLFNIGGEGQMLVGGIASAIVGALALSNLGSAHLLLCLITGMVCGMAWAWLSAWLHTARGVHEVISTIMLNFIAFHLVNELTFGWFLAAPGSSRTAMIQSTAEMPVIWQFGNTPLTWSVAISIVIAIGVTVFMYRTWSGFQLRAAGGNQDAARYSGISVNRMKHLAMLVGGACAGLAGALETTAVSHAFFSRFHSGYGFDGIAVAFLALCEPLAVIPAAFFLAVLRAADRSLQLELGIPKEVVFVLEGVLIVCVAVFMKRGRKAQARH